MMQIIKDIRSIAILQPHTILINHMKEFLQMEMWNTNTLSMQMEN